MLRIKETPLGARTWEENQFKDVTVFSATTINNQLFSHHEMSQSNSTSLIFLLATNWQIKYSFFLPSLTLLSFLHALSCVFFIFFFKPVKHTIRHVVLGVFIFYRHLVNSYKNDPLFMKTAPIFAPSAVNCRTWSTMLGVCGEGAAAHQHRCAEIKKKIKHLNASNVFCLPQLESGQICIRRIVAAFKIQCVSEMCSCYCRNVWRAEASESIVVFVCLFFIVGKLGQIGANGTFRLQSVNW